MGVTYTPEYSGEGLWVAYHELYYKEKQRSLKDDNDDPARSSTPSWIESLTLNYHGDHIVSNQLVISGLRHTLNFALSPG